MTKGGTKIFENHLEEIEEEPMQNTMSLNQELFKNALDSVTIPIHDMLEGPATASFRNKLVSDYDVTFDNHKNF